MISEFVQAWEGFIFFVFIISMPLSVFFMWAGLRAIKFGKITLFVLICTSFFFFLFTYTATIIFAGCVSLPPPIGYILGLSVSFLPIKILFRAKQKNILILWLMCFLGQILGLLIAAQLAIGGIDDLLAII